MAMTRTVWSINALSVELGIDRRTVARRLQGVTPADLGPDGSPRWRLADAVPALIRSDNDYSAKPMRPPPAGCEILEQVPNPAHAGFVTAWLEIIANIQPLAASALMASGLSRKQAEPAIAHLFVALVTFADHAAKAARIPPWLDEDEPSWVPVDKMLKPDWAALVAFGRQLKTGG